jgi:hypothetical protein
MTTRAAGIADDSSIPSRRPGPENAPVEDRGAAPPSPATPRMLAQTGSSCAAAVTYPSHRSKTALATAPSLGCVPPSGAYPMPQLASTSTGAEAARGVVPGRCGVGERVGAGAAVAVGAGEVVAGGSSARRASRRIFG